MLNQIIKSNRGGNIAVHNGYCYNQRERLMTASAKKWTNLQSILEMTGIVCSKRPRYEKIKK